MAPGGIINDNENMKIEISTGLEARPVAVFVQVASQFESSIYVEVGNKKLMQRALWE